MREAPSLEDIERMWSSLGGEGTCPGVVALVTRAERIGQELHIARPAEACTGIAASWCPRCGTCTCPFEKHGDNPTCPLHAENSTHADDGVPDPLVNARVLASIFQSIRASMVTMPHDWRSDHRFAWQYAILVGWGDTALAEVATRHRWDDVTLARLRGYRAVVNAISPTFTSERHA